MAQKGNGDRKDAERRLIEKASQDPDFRASLLNDPKATVAREFDIEDMPEDLNIRVIEETSTELVIVLPPDLSSGMDDGQLHANTKWIFF